RKSIQGGLFIPRTLPAITPRLISMSATDTPSSTEAMLAKKIRTRAMTAIERSMNSRPPCAQMKDPYRTPVGVISPAKRGAALGEPHRHDCALHYRPRPLMVKKGRRRVVTRSRSLPLVAASSTPVAMVLATLLPALARGRLSLVTALLPAAAVVRLPARRAL